MDTYIALTKDVSEYKKDTYNMLVKAFCNLKYEIYRLHMKAFCEFNCTIHSVHTKAFSKCKRGVQSTLYIARPCEKVTHRDVECQQSATG